MQQWWETKLVVKTADMSILQNAVMSVKKCIRTQKRGTSSLTSQDVTAIGILMVLIQANMCGSTKVTPWAIAIQNDSNLIKRNRCDLFLEITRAQMTKNMFP